MSGGFRRKRAREEQRVRVDANGLMRDVVGKAGLADEDLEALGLRLDERAAALERQCRLALVAVLSAKEDVRRTVHLADQVRGKFAYGLAGRPGYEAERAEVQRLTARREARYVV